MELKKALTHEKLIDRMINYHGLNIKDRQKAEWILNRVNYYRLSAYGIGLTQIDNKEKYINGITLEHLFRLYCFDSQFKNNLIHTIEQIEIQFRTQISNYLALKYGVECYMQAAYFDDIIRKQDNTSVHENIINKFKQEVNRQKEIPFVKHHLQKYDGRFPIWVAFELFTFGNLVSLFDIMKADDKTEIAKQYNTSYNHLKSWLLALVEVRNICAHYTRLYNLPLKQTPYLYKEGKKYRGSKNKIFPVLLVIKRLLNSNEQWKSLYKDIVLTTEKYKDVINLSFMGFPSNWEEIL